MDVQSGAQRSAPAGFDLEPEIVLPAQFFNRSILDAGLQAEKRLMLAVLEEAVSTYQKYADVPSRAGRRLFGEAADWFASDDGSWPFAFVTVCEALSIDAPYLRRGLSAWLRRLHESRARGANVVRFPFRRVNGTRHSVTGRPIGLKRLAS